MYRGIIASLVVLIVCSTLIARGFKEITFPDSNLKTAVRKAIDKLEGSILSTDLKGLC